MKILFLGDQESELVLWLKQQGEQVVASTEIISLEEIQNINPEIIISYNYRHILKPEIFNFPSHGAINLHISYLPYNRGADPNLWSFVENTPKGVTIHYIDQGLDTGDIIARNETIFNEESEILQSSYAKLHVEIRKLFKEQWSLIKNGSIKRTKQPSKGTYHSKKDRTSIDYLIAEHGWNTPVKVLKSQPKNRKQGVVIASIEARTGSTRLPGKTMRQILGKPILELMIERVKRAKLVDKIVIATSTKKGDKALEELAKKLTVACFRGCEDDVLARVLQAAQANEADHIVELWGDTTLIDPEIIDRAINYYMNNDFDCVGTCLDKTYPWGISLLVFSTETLAEVEQLTNDPVDRENVSTYIYGNPDKYRIGHLPCPPELNRPELRLVVDELPDFILMEKIFEHFYPTKPEFNTLDIIRFFDKYPELMKVNKDVKQKIVKGVEYA